MAVDKEPWAAPKLRCRGDEEIAKASARHPKKVFQGEWHDPPGIMLPGSQVGGYEED